MTDLEAIVQAFQSRAWYPFAAALLTLLIALWRRLQPNVWDLIPTRLQWLPALLVAGAGGFVDAFVSGATLLVALATAVYAMVGGGVTSIGVLHTARRMAGVGSAASHTGKVGIVLLGALLCATGCASVRSTARDVSDVAHDMCEAVLAQRAEVRAQADRQGVSPLDVARGLCALNDVVRPFLAGAQQAGDEAVGAAQRVGKLQR